MIRPLYDRIIVKRSEAETMTSGGLHIPDESREKPAEGIVIAVGKGSVGDNGNIIPMVVKEGDKVIFSQYTGNLIGIGDEEYLIMSEYEVLAVMED